MNTRILIASILGIVLALDVHECFHAWVADRLGDSTARHLGRISLNPLVHLDPMGTMMMLFAAMSGRGIGWGKPVPVNPIRLKYGPRVGMGIVSFAGPFANLSLAALLSLPFRLGVNLPGTVPLLVLQVILINISLAVFNLIPLPPLDGYGVLQGILASIRGPTSYRLSQSLAMLERQGPVLLLLLIFGGQFLGVNLLGSFMDPLISFFARWILGY